MRGGGDGYLDISQIIRATGDLCVSRLKSRRKGHA